MNQPPATLLHQKLATLFSRINYERQDKATPKSFKLDNMRRLLTELGNPHLNYPVIHVAGTKGKGSVAAIIASILTHSGLKVGVYSSPHLETFHQRMKIDGAAISDQQLLEVLEFVEPFVSDVDIQLDKIGYRGLTFFEVATGAMFEHFSRQAVDVAVVEVGLGGRLDSTNVCDPALTVITNISFDHMAQLGNSLDAIAGEKAGIIKPTVPVICGASQPESIARIHSVAKENNAPVWQLDRDFSFQNQFDAATGKDLFEVSGKLENGRFTIPSLTCGLLGEHQKANSAVAVAAVLSLPAIRTSLADDIIRSGIANVSLEGRIEKFNIMFNNERRPVILDIAHNEASIQALVDVLATTLARNETFSRKHLVFATSRDKDSEKMLRRLLPNFDRVCLTKYQNNPRGVPVEQLFQLCKTVCSDFTNPAPSLETDCHPVQAVKKSLENSNPGDLVVITGSAFLIAELRPWVLQNAAAQADSIPTAIGN